VSGCGLDEDRDTDPFCTGRSELTHADGVHRQQDAF
jgi:hypothetical protein